ncbi:metallophosphoesterase [Luteipulveratus halotolerans]|uniref:Metallophosphoesterase n=1 Tax=Luteipulveratus halotolerans TaxID=1631356 RepID=A0A0L6CE01_9MICO|nr:metallophosphoesterase [Luteipulveratus halotolerans]KNX36096.1 metallophosphoesterase [Luteipulveratus halotolerans]
MSVVRRVAATTVAAGAASLAWATLVERHWYAVRRAHLPVLAPGSKPRSVLHVSDLHLVPRQEHRIRWVQALAGLEPDYVVNTGDNCSDLHAVPAVLRAFEPLMHVPGAFVLGSNDYFAPQPKNPLRYFDLSHRRGADMGMPSLPVAELVAGFTAGGWTDLTNRRTRTDIRGLDVELVGVDDPHLDYDRYDAVTAPADPRAALTLGVVHAPYTRVLDAMSSDGAQLILAGHTHGGQLAVPFYGALVTNCDLDQRRARGVSRWWPGAVGRPDSEAPSDATWLNVSAGLGHSKYAPARFACRPEASLLTLVPRGAEPIS